MTWDALQNPTIHTDYSSLEGKKKKIVRNKESFFLCGNEEDIISNNVSTVLRIFKMLYA